MSKLPLTTGIIDKATFEAEEPILRGQLIDAQFDLLESAAFPVIVLLSGLDELGRSAMAKQLLSWMDPRHVQPYAAISPSQEELDRPRMWRFWRAMPKKGQVGIFLNAWYENPALEYFLGNISRKDYKAHIHEINQFEQLHADNGALFLKVLFVNDEERDRKTLKRLHKDSSAWKLSDEEKAISKFSRKKYKRTVKVMEDLVKATNTHSAPWVRLDSSDANFRDLTVGRLFVKAIRDRLDAPPPAKTKRRRTAKSEVKTVLDTLDLTKSLDRDLYRTRLKEEQRRLTALTLGKKFENRALVAVFEGNDAAGKGSSIRRVVQALDPRMMKVVPIAAPSEEERAHAYLWRFWRHIPRKDNITIFDRSWYGRVLVERIEGFCSEADWTRAYDEIKAFEQELTDYGVIAVKFWLAIDKREQLKRFREREKIGYKRYKITDEDWRNRRKWNAYAQAVHDMVERTSTKEAPWTLVEANDKYFARVKVIETITQRLEASL